MSVGARREDRVVLGADQERALATLEAAIAARRFEAHLLHGVTGSGKTEVYLRAAEAALAQGRGVIVLVPEIGLTPQTVTRFAERFGSTVAVAHSRLSAGERHDEWMRLRGGEARICVGPRSAVFAPIERLGLIVVDEEHDSSYKHEGDPRYDAREVALRRAQREGALLRRRQRDAAAGELRADGAARARRPRRRQPAARGRGARHARRAGRAAPAHRRGARAAAPRGRQGDRAAQPPRLVELPLVPLLRQGLGLPGVRRRARAAPRRGRDRLPPLRPPRAGAASAATPAGRAASRATAWAPSASSTSCAARSAARSSRCSASTPTSRAGRGRAADVLARFERAPAGVLIGTQMVAKGHDFDGVALGVVLDADATLRFPDFRAEERTFALVAQLAGRAGRGGTPGRVLVQTLTPEARSIVAAARHDSEGFLAASSSAAARCATRRTASSCGSSAPRSWRARRSAPRRAARADRRAGGELLGPAPLFRLRGRERAQIVVKAADRAAAVAAIGEAVARPLGRDVAVSVDVDPQ